MLRISRGSAIQLATSWEKIVALGEWFGKDDDVPDRLKYRHFFSV